MWQVDMEQTIWNFGVLEFFLEDKLTQFKKTKISYSLSLLPWLYHSHPLFIPSPSLSYTPPYMMISTLHSLDQCDSAQQLTH